MPFFRRFLSFPARVRMSRFLLLAFSFFFFSVLPIHDSQAQNPVLSSSQLSDIRRGCETDYRYIPPGTDPSHVQRTPAENQCFERRTGCVRAKIEETQDETILTVPGYLTGLFRFVRHWIRLTIVLIKLFRTRF